MKNLEANTLHVLANPPGTPIEPLDVGAFPVDLAAASEANAEILAELAVLAEVELVRLEGLADEGLAILEGLAFHNGPAVDLRLGHNVRPTL